MSIGIRIGCLLCIMLLLSPAKMVAQSGDSAVKELVRLGFENVSCSDVNGERVYVLQNMSYSLHGVGMSKAVDVIQTLGLPAEGDCRIVVLDNNVPQYSVLYKRGENAASVDSIPSVTSRSEWETTYLLGDSWNEARKAKRSNSSLYKVDIVVSPDLMFKNMLLSRIYTYVFSLNPSIEISLWEGMKIDAQVIFPLHRDFNYHELYGKIRPGYLTVSQSFRVQNLFVTATVGNFNAFHWGVAVKGKYVFKDPRFFLEGEFAKVGVSSTENFKLDFEKLEQSIYKIGGSFYWPQMNAQFDLRYERFLRDDTGVRFQITRHMRKATIGVFGTKTLSYDHRYAIANDGINGGFFFSIALPPYGKYKRKGYMPRVRPAENFGITYVAGNEKRFGKSVNTQLGNNARSRNSFNPIFIKSELLNF